MYCSLLFFVDYYTAAKLTLYFGFDTKCLHSLSYMLKDEGVSESHSRDKFLYPSSYNALKISDCLADRYKNLSLLCAFCDTLIRFFLQIAVCLFVRLFVLIKLLDPFLYFCLQQSLIRQIKLVSRSIDASVQEIPV